MKITRGEWLLLVAIVTSATVAEVHELALPSARASAGAQAQASAREYQGRTSACGEAQNGMLRATCTLEREQHSVDSGDHAADRAINRADKPRAGKVWV
jgi:hypothetical protein